MQFAAVHESHVGTFRTWRDVRLESAMRPKADVDLHPGQATYEKTPSALDGV